MIGISKICQYRADVKHMLVVAHTGIQWVGDVVEVGDVLLCPLYCLYYYVDMLPAHLSGIPGDVEDRDDVD